MIPGSDGLVRLVKLFKGDENYRENPKIVIHSSKHLIPLELSVTHDVKERDLIVNETDLEVIDESGDDGINIMENAQDYEPNDLDNIGGEALTSDVRSDDEFTPVGSSLELDPIGDIPLESRSRRCAVARRPLDDDFIFLRLNVVYLIYK